MTRTALSFLALSSLVAMAVPACGGSSTDNNGQPTDDAGATDDASTDAGADVVVEAAVDAGPDVDNGSPSTNYPAPHPPLPNVANAGGPVLHTPKVQFIFYEGYPYQSDLEGLAGSLGASSYWSATTSEYGVGPIGFTSPSIVIASDAGAAPATITDMQIDSYINGLLTAGASGPLGAAPDPNTIYTIVYPQSTTITMSGGGPTGGTSSSCTDFGGYHNNTTVGAQDYAYAVIPTCATFGNLVGKDGVTGATSHEWIEAVTDPFPNTNPAYSNVDQNHFVWELLGGGEAGDLCVQEVNAFFKPQDLMPYTVQRTWSNKLAMASHDPCAPNIAGLPFFDSAPVLPDHVTLNFGGAILTQGVKIPVGMSKTIEVDLFSDAATSGPWTVKAIDALSQLAGGAPTMSFQWDRTQGQNGEKLHLTITVTTASTYGGAHPFIIVSALKGIENLWPALAVEK